MNIRLVTLTKVQEHHKQDLLLRISTLQNIIGSSVACSTMWVFRHFSIIKTWDIFLQIGFQQWLCCQANRRKTSTIADASMCSKRGEKLRFGIPFLGGTVPTDWKERTLNPQHLTVKVTVMAVTNKMLISPQAVDENAITVGTNILLGLPIKSGNCGGNNGASFFQLAFLCNFKHHK